MPTEKIVFKSNGHICNILLARGLCCCWPEGYVAAGQRVILLLARGLCCCWPEGYVAAGQRVMLSFIKSTCNFDKVFMLVNADHHLKKIPNATSEVTITQFYFYLLTFLFFII